MTDSVYLSKTGSPIYFKSGDPNSIDEAFDAFKTRDTDFNLKGVVAGLKLSDMINDVKKIANERDDFDDVRISFINVPPRHVECSKVDEPDIQGDNLQMDDLSR